MNIFKKTSDGRPQTTDHRLQTLEGRVEPVLSHEASRPSARNGHARAWPSPTTAQPEVHGLKSKVYGLSAFTLIELLLVIAIIGILVALLFPAISGAIKKSKVGKARTEVKSIEYAIRMYYTEYGKFPGGSAPTTSSNFELMNVLRAINGTGNSSHVNNPKQIVFLEVPSKSLDDNGFVDPWKTVYQIAFDSDYDNSVTPLDYGALSGQTVAVYSSGPDKLSNTAATQSDDIKSW